MLIYNFQKEFLGIDEDDLKALGFANLQELRAESADFADMFVKTPGHVHNFTHVHWIDFVTCSDYHEDSKVIIHANNKNYKCSLNIKTAYLVDNPSQKAFLVNLSNLVELTPRENEQISKDIYDKPIPVSTTASNPIFNTPEFETIFDSDDMYTTQELEPESESEPEPEPVVVDQFDKYEVAEKKTVQESAPKVIQDNFIEENPQENYLDLQTSTTHEEDYVYDPMVASKALGLPVDLIEEFLQDFIIQSKEFQSELYDSLARDDLSNVKILSHKLKGVAANLRVEDALDALTIINSSDDIHEIKANMVNFYTIISHLAGDAPREEKTTEPIQENSQEETTVSPVKEVKETQIVEEDEFVISFKDDEETAIEEPIISNISEEKEIEPLEFKEQMQEFEEKIEEEKLSIEFDRNLAAGEIGLDVDSYNELLKDYIQESLMSVDSINKAIEEEDFHMWKKHALKLKGMSDNMRIDIFMKELEKLSNTQDATIAQKAIHDIATKVKQISLVEG